MNYPDKHDLYKQIKTHYNHIIINAKSCAKDMGNTKVCNMILLGAAAEHLPLEEEKLLRAIRYLFRDKSEKIILKNIDAFKEGQKKAKAFLYART